jgi:hypothetical protein
MTRLLAILTAGSISLHALLGCYGLHLCAADASEHCQIACDHQGCDHDHSHSDGSGDCCLVCRGAATYLPPERSSIDDSLTVAVASMPTASIGLGNERCAARVADMQGIALAPPLRLHLLHQILLI